MRSGSSSGVLAVRGRVAPYVLSLAVYPAVLLGPQVVAREPGPDRPEQEDQRAVSDAGLSIDALIRDCVGAWRVSTYEVVEPDFNDTAFSLPQNRRTHRGRVKFKPSTLVMAEEPADYEHIL